MLRHFAEGAFGNRHINLMNLHVGLVNFGQFLRMQISVVFLASLGLPPTQIFLLMALLVGTRFIYRTPLMLIGHCYGSKVSLVLGQLILALAFAFYTQVDGLGLMLWISLFLMSVGEALYWHALHAAYAVLSEKGKFGRQLAARTIFMNFGALAAPLATIALAGTQGWLWLFVLAGLVMLLSIVPLFFIPEPSPPTPIRWREGFAASKKGMKLFLGSAGQAACLFFIWPLIIYYQFGTLQKVGSVMAATMVCSILLMIFVARRIDLGKAQLIVRLGPWLFAGVLMLLAGFGRDALSIIILTALLDLTHTLYRHPYGAAVYRWSKEVHNPQWYCYWLEFGWDIGVGLTLIFAAGILFFMPTLDLRWLMTLALPAIAWSYWVYITDGMLMHKSRKALP